MFNRYSSPYPNYIHQLFITPSKHLHVLKDKRLKWQNKAMEVQLDGIERADREHVVHYILSDHNSSAFYAEIGTSKAMEEPTAFLARAWSKKPGHFFHGLPENLIVPAAVQSKYPRIMDWLKQLDIQAVPPSSGFYAGIHQVRNWEKDVASAVSFHDSLENTPCTMGVLCSKTMQIMEMSNGNRINRPGVRLTRQQLWERAVEGRPPIRPMR